MTLFLLFWLTPTIILYFFMYVEHNVSKKSRWAIAADLLFYAFPIANMIMGIVWFCLSENKLSNRKKTLNQVKKCNHCNVSSRVWQIPILKNEERCPVCESPFDHYIKMDPNDTYPFAKKIQGIPLYAYILREGKRNRLHQKVQSLTAYDQEVEAYQQVQKKKLEQYQQKAEEIVQLAKKQG